MLYNVGIKKTNVDSPQQTVESKYATECIYIFKIIISKVREPVCVSCRVSRYHQSYRLVGLIAITLRLAILFLETTGARYQKLTVSIIILSFINNIIYYVIVIKPYFQYCFLLLVLIFHTSLHVNYCFRYLKVFTMSMILYLFLKIK